MPRPFSPQVSQLTAEVSNLAAERDALEREADQMQRDVHEMAAQLQVWGCLGCLSVCAGTICTRSLL